jgi:hypothetical protein
MVQKLKLNIYLKMSEFVKYIFLTYRNAEIKYLGCQSAEDDKRQTRKLQEFYGWDINITKQNRLFLTWLVFE